MAVKNAQSALDQAQINDAASVANARTALINAQKALEAAQQSAMPPASAP
jgi:hypothetical protein